MQRSMYYNLFNQQYRMKTNDYVVKTKANLGIS